MQDIYSENKKKLGFGLMRLPTGEAGAIDLATTTAMADEFMASGHTYFDTAYLYHGKQSEPAVKAVLSSRKSRESFTIASKMPLWNVEQPEDLETIFQEQLANCGVDYFDFYLLHSISATTKQKADDMGAWAYLAELKRRGLARYVGFSFHDNADMLDELLGAHPEVEFIQLQINYMDWESETIQSRRCYEVARKHNKPVVIMEPLKGGALANLPASVEEKLREGAPGQTPVSLALRFALSLDGVLCVLSGMSAPEQMRENLAIEAAFEPLSENERALLAQAAAEMSAMQTVPCTACRYCVDACPIGMPVSEIIKLYNNYLAFGFLPSMVGGYAAAIRTTAKASDCQKCGVCEDICPQKIEIIDVLEKSVGIFE